MNNNATTGAFYGGFCCGLSFVVFPILFFLLTTPWLKCFLSGSPFTALHILGMRLRGTPVSIVTDAHIALTHSGIQIDPRRVESAYLSSPTRVQTAADLVNLVRWGLYEADPKPRWAIDETAMMFDKTSGPQLPNASP